MKKVDKLTDGVNKFNFNEKEERKHKDELKKRPTLVHSNSIKEPSEVLASLYTIEKTIGNGTFGVVYQVTFIYLIILLSPSKPYYYSPTMV